MKDLVFKVQSWHCEDISEISETDAEGFETLSHHIYLFGNMHNKKFDPELPINYLTNSPTKSVCLNVTGFNPYYYILVPDSATDEFANKIFKRILSSLENSIKYRFEQKGEYNRKPGLVSYKFLKRKKLYPYTAGKLYNFVKLNFTCLKDYNNAKYIINKGIRINAVDHIFKIFESKVDPLIKFIHARKLESTGYIYVKDFIVDTDNKDGRTVIKILAESKNVCLYNPENVPETARVNTDLTMPLKILSFDIETQSHDGESFPSPLNDGDYIGMIGITMWTYGLGKCNKHKVCADCDFLKKNKTDEQKAEVKNKSEQDLCGACRTCKVCDRSQRFIFVLGKCNPVPDTIVIEAESEKDLLIKYCQLIKQLDPDIMTGYNTWRFDEKYISLRMDRFGLEDLRNMMSRITVSSTKLIKRELNSGAYGNNEFEMINYYGVDTIDALVAIKREHKLESYKLDDVSKHFLNMEKDDVHPHEIFKMMAGTPEERAIVAKYCMKDTNLVIELIKHLNMVPNSNEMAGTTYVPNNWLLYKGQQCKVFSLIIRECRDREFLVPDKLPFSEEDFAGATVLDPMRGAYYVPVAGLDFASLYPSIMIAHNLCYSTIVLDDKYNDLEGVNYESIEWFDDPSAAKEQVLDEVLDEIVKEDNDAKGSEEFYKTDIEIGRMDKEAIVDEMGPEKPKKAEKPEKTTVSKKEKENKHYKYTYVQDPDNSYVSTGNPFKLGPKITEGLDRTKCYRGILPSILISLKVGRSNTKKKMKELLEKDPANKSSDYYKVLDAIQISQKITMNSIYGFCGTSANGVLPCREISSTVTARGRQMIVATKNMAEESYDCTALYGDSIPGTEYVYCEYKDPKNYMKIRVSEFEKLLGNEACWVPWKTSSMENKEQLDLTSFHYTTLSGSGPTKIQRIIRHKTMKKLYRIKARDSKGNIRTIVVTEGHSLVAGNKMLIEADKVKIGTELYEL